MKLSFKPHFKISKESSGLIKLGRISIYTLLLIETSWKIFSLMSGHVGYVLAKNI